MEYRDAIKYARRIAFDWRVSDYRDLVHDAWVDHYGRKKEDLFTRDIGYVCKAIKWRMNRNRQGRSFLVGKDRFNYTFVSEADYDFPTTDSPETLMCREEFFTVIHDQIVAYGSSMRTAVKGEDLLKVAALLHTGYHPLEIGPMMNISPQTVSNYRKKVREIVRTISITIV